MSNPRVPIKQRVIAKVEAVGGEIEIRKGHPFEIIIDAPDGYLWKGDGLHCLVHSVWDDQKTTELWQDAWRRISDGLEQCDDSECDACHPTE